MITLWGRITSINVQKVVFAAGETGAALERRDAGGAFGIVGTPEFKAKNPNGMIPVIEDDGLVLWESNAIVRYIAARYGAGTLWPEDPRARAVADQWADWQQTVLGRAMGPAFLGLVRTPPEKRDMAAIEAACKQTEAAFDMLEAQIARHGHVAGERMTFADVILAPAAHRWLHMPVTRASRPALESWYAAMAARPAAKPALPLPVV
ncbi:glutathione S-transferase family protein [Alsobacter sp. R-9]